MGFGGWRGKVVDIGPTDIDDVQGAVLEVRCSRPCHDDGDFEDEEVRG
jgi:hypothetical protein